jgi:tRNA pseudouridine38-40 synthase
VPTLRLELEYDGSDFSGWAAQPGRRTVEGALREALAPLVPADLELAVAGRTDAGVHARGQVVSLMAERLPEPDRLAGALRARLPGDVSVLRLARAAEGFNARFAALARRYEYRVLPGPRSALRRNRVLCHPVPLDRAALDAAAAATRGTHDFRAFTPTQTQHVFFRRTVTECRWAARGDELVLVIEADAFLRHMVRILVGTQLLVGRGAWPQSRYTALLDGAPRGAAGPTAPAHALTLVGVTYDPAAPAG